jgi:hypothetical protein
MLKVGSGKLGRDRELSAMAVRESRTRREIPASLIDAIEGSHLTVEQLRKLIAWEAEEIGLSYDEAVRQGRQRTLPKNASGMDLEGLVLLLPE